MSNTAPSRADPVVVFPLSRWCPSQETSQPHQPPYVQLNNKNKLLLMNDTCWFFSAEHACDLAVINLTAIKWALGEWRKWHGLWKHRSYLFPWMKPAICHCVSVLWRVSPWGMISWMIATWGQGLVQYLEAIWKANLTRPCSLMAAAQERRNSILLKRTGVTSFLH